MEIFHTNSLQSQLMEAGTQNKEPYVGMPCTENWYSDRRACTITSVNKSKTRITTRENKVECLDWYEGKYKIFPELIEHMPCDFEGNNITDFNPLDYDKVFTKRKNGRWVREGSNMRDGLGVSLGVHSHYVDPHF